ncbi:MAG: tRNA (N(6)-L-threonylcarbamoyladenosine(37)-C(2))-methylthiotransferase MtaB [Parvularculaceae bacterium]
MRDAPEIITLGCRLNTYESEAMRGLARNAGLGEAVIVNTCAVTAEAVRQARQAIRRARARAPAARIIVTGCAAQIDPASFAQMEEVDAVLGNHEKMRAGDWAAMAAANGPETELRVGDVMAVRELAPQLVEGFAERARAFLQIQNGCDHRCTFCVIPYGRGPARSAPMGAVVEQARQLVAKGFREVVLTGVDITSYGGDLPGAPTLGRLVGKILDLVPELPRLRLSSLDTIEIDDELFARITEDMRLMPHLHLSLQSGDDMILKRMKRRHSSAEAIRFVERVKARRPEIAIGADLIAGFPTETDEMHAANLRHLDDCDVVYGHIFPYSPREGTPAARMPQLDRSTVKARAAELRARAAERRAIYDESLVGGEFAFLGERGGVARTPSFAEAEIAGAEIAPGEIARARITGRIGGRLRASRTDFQGAA